MTARLKLKVKRGGLATATPIASVFLIIKDILKGTIVPVLTIVNNTALYVATSTPRIVSEICTEPKAKVWSPLSIGSCLKDCKNLFS